MSGTDAAAALPPVEAATAALHSLQVGAGDPVSPAAVVGPRSDYISKECWYMSMAILASQRSKDPQTQVRGGLGGKWVGVGVVGEGLVGLVKSGICAKLLSLTIPVQLRRTPEPYHGLHPAVRSTTYFPFFNLRFLFFSKVGSCLVSPAGVLVSMGYNGFPVGCSDTEVGGAIRAY